MIPHIAVFLGFRLVLAALGFPACHPASRSTGAPGDAEGAVWHVLGNRRAGCHVGTLRLALGRKRLSADECPVLDDRRVFFVPS